MITAVDSSVLLDVLGADPSFGPRSVAALNRCRTEGGLVACEVVWAEVGGWFPTPLRAEEFFEQIGVGFVALDRSASIAAGRLWRARRRRGGRRDRVVADFLVGSHALTQADRLLTRDRGFYRIYFKKLAIVDPSRAL